MSSVRWIKGQIVNALDETLMYDERLKQLTSLIFRLRIASFHHNQDLTEFPRQRTFQRHVTMENLQDIKLSTASDTGVALIQFNRPAKRNAFSQNTINEIVTTLDHLDSVDTVRAVVLTGGPEGHFCGKFRVSPSEEQRVLWWDKVVLIMRLLIEFREQLAWI
jgi:hypothetical protein